MRDINLSTMSKAEANRLLRRVYRLMSHDGFRVRFSYGKDGEDVIGWVDKVQFYYDNECEVYLDPRYDILNTCLHECIHVLYPEEADEEWIEGLTCGLIRYLSPRQFRNILIKIANTSS